MTRALWLIDGTITEALSPLTQWVDVASAETAAVDGRDVVIWSADPAQRAAISKKLLSNGHSAASVKVVQTAQGWSIAERIATDPVLWTFDTLHNLVGAKGLEVLADKPLAKPKKAAAKVVAGDAPTDAGVPAFQLWDQLGLARDGRGPYATEANALLILKSHSNYAGKIWLDDFAQRLMFDSDDGPKPLDEIELIRAQIWIQQALQLPKMPLQAIERAARLAAQQNRRHPVRQWLHGLAWDGIERLPTLMADAFGAAQNDYTAAVGRCWITAMVARVMHPGCQADYMPVFEGEQGIRKSSAMRILGGDWFTESSEDPLNGRKDFLQALQGKWLVEIPEMHAIASRFSGVEKIKAIISIRVDSYRVPYGRATMDYPRQCIFAGTTNSPEWNADPSGGRRFWPIACGQISLDYLSDNRDQLFAEAAARYARGEPWHDVPNGAAKDEQEQRRQRDEWESVIERYIHESPDRFDRNNVTWRPREKPLEEVSVAALLEHALGIDPSRWTRSDQMRVAGAMQALGWRKVRTRQGENRKNAYRKELKVEG